MPKRPGETNVDYERRLLDEALAGGQTADQLLAGARGTLQRTGETAQRLNREGQRGTLEREQARLEDTAAHPYREIGRHAMENPKQVLDSLAAIASMIPSPVQVPAAAYTTASMGAEALQNPTPLNVGFAALGALPFAKGLKGLRGAGAAARYTGEAADVLHGADAATDVLGRVGAGAGRAGTGFDAVGSEVDDMIRGLNDIQPSSVSGYRATPIPRAAGEADELVRMTEGARPDRYVPNISGFDVTGRDAAYAPRLMRGQAEASRFRAPSSAEPLDLGPASQVEDVMAGIGPSGRRVAGFSDLPELSQSEADRIAANIRRVEEKRRSRF